MVGLTQFDIGGDFDDRARVVTGAGFVGVGAEDEGSPAEDFARDEIDVHVTAVFTAFEAEAIGGQAIVVREVDVQRPRKKAQAGFALIVIAELRDPLREVALAAANGAVEFQFSGVRSPALTKLKFPLEILNTHTCTGSSTWTWPAKLAAPFGQIRLISA